MLSLPKLSWNSRTDIKPVHSSSARTVSSSSGLLKNAFATLAELFILPAPGKNARTVGMVSRDFFCVRFFGVVQALLQAWV